MALADVQTLVDNLVRDDSGRITTANRDEAIGLAVERYSKDRPRPKVEDLTADGDKTLALPTAWETEFSELRSLEYPTGDSPPTLIPSDQWDLYTDPTSTVILLVSAIAAAKTVRAAFTIKHVLDGATDTVPLGDREAFAAYAAAILLYQLATHFSGRSNSVIRADSVDHGSKAEDYSRRARALETRYLDHLGVPRKRSSAAGVVVDLDSVSSRGRARLTHPDKWR